MYHTPAGDRVLRGAERRLFVHSLAIMVDLLTDSDGDCEFGTTVFDTLTQNQKVAILYKAARCLLCPDEPMPRLTAVLEGAVGTVYRFAEDLVMQEVEEPDVTRPPPTFRSLVLEAARETHVCDDDSRTNGDKADWEILLKCLADRVLWDDDFDVQDWQDANPETRLRLKQRLGIEDDYYTDVAPDPPDAQIRLYLDALRGLTAEVR
jgi:hypothetical protein